MVDALHGGAGLAEPDAEEGGGAVLVAGACDAVLEVVGDLSTLAIGTAYPTTSLLPLDAAVVMPTTSPSASYVAPPESPEITSLLILISPVSLSPVAVPSLCVVIDWSSAITLPAAALR